LELNPRRRAASGLDAEAFAVLLARIDPDPDRAAARYVEIRRRLVRLLEWRGCASPEALVDETMDRVAGRLGEGVEIRTGDPYAYFAGVARFVLKEAIKRQQREREAVREWQASSVWPMDAAESKTDCMAQCLDALAPASRGLLTRYYEGRGRERIATRHRVAQEMGVGIQVLRLRLHRMREGLKDCLGDCLKKATGDGNGSAVAPYKDGGMK
jgi:DNA-directed RNA polymerase specialized sigma24 family protein